MARAPVLATVFIEAETRYDGTQLCSHWIYRNTGIQGDAIAAFVGGAEVNLDNLVDLEDVAAKAPIYSSKMLHFLVEHFDVDLSNMILRQRLLMTLLQEELNEVFFEERTGSSQSEPKQVTRRGDDLFIGPYKLTVSIATASPVSSVIHAAINIISEGTPVPTLGLADFGLNPQAFARSVLNRYRDEMTGVAIARCKVRAVP